MKVRVPLPTPVPETKNWVIVTVPDGLTPRMSAAVGTPEGGISQPASGRRHKKAIAAANAGEPNEAGRGTHHLPPLINPALEQPGARWNVEL